MKIKEEQLERIKKQQQDLGKLLNDIGYLEANKHALLHELADINKEIDEFKNELEKEYGQVNIDLEDGSYKPLEKEELKAADV